MLETCGCKTNMIIHELRREKLIFIPRLRLDLRISHRSKIKMGQIPAAEYVNHAKQDCN